MNVWGGECLGGERLTIEKSSFSFVFISPSLSLLFLSLIILLLGVFMGLIFLFLHQMREGLQEGTILGQIRVGVSPAIPATLPTWR